MKRKYVVLRKSLKGPFDFLQLWSATNIQRKTFGFSEHPHDFEAKFCEKGPFKYILLSDKEKRREVVITRLAKQLFDRSY